MTNAKKFLTSYVLFFSAMILLVLYSSPKYSSVVTNNSGLSKQILIAEVDETITSVEVFNNFDSQELVVVDFEEVPLGFYEENNGIDTLIRNTPLIIVTTLFIFILLNGKYFIKKIEN